MSKSTTDVLPSALPPIIAALLIGLSLVGLADSIYLTYDHGAFHADPSGYGGGLCGADGGCSISRSSALSEIPLPGAKLGLPTSVLALGFYVVFLVLTIMRARALPDTERHLARLQLALALLSNLFSLTLLGYSLAEGSVCKFCAILYGVNLALLWVTWRGLGEKVGDAVSAIGRAVFSRAGGVATLVMLASLVGGYVIYRGQVLAAQAAVPAKEVVLDTTNRPHKGPADAPVHIVEMADFECPHCKVAFQTLEEIIAARKDVRVTFLHFPLDQACNPMIDRPFHPRACELAAIGECAHAQGRFFDAAPLIFEGAPTDALLEQLANKGFDRAALETCMKSDATKQRLAGDIQSGIDAKIGGTPAVFLNGAQVGGALPKDKLEELIDVAKEAPALKNAKGN